MADFLGFFNTSGTRTVVRFSFTTSAQTGATIAPSSTFEAADLLIYKNGSATERSSTSGVTMTSSFDSKTWLHNVSIDLTDNTDAGFYAAGAFYECVMAPDETVDSLAVGAVVARFEIGLPEVNVTQLAGTAYATEKTALVLAFWDFAISGTIKAKELMRGFAAMLLGKTSGAGTGTVTMRNVQDTLDAAIITIVGSNRTAYTLDLSA